MTIVEVEQLLALISQESQIRAEVIATYKRRVQRYHVRVTHKPRQRTVLLTSTDEWDSVRDAWREL